MAQILRKDHARDIFIRHLTVFVNVWPKEAVTHAAASSDCDWREQHFAADIANGKYVRSTSRIKLVGLDVAFVIQLDSHVIQTEMLGTSSTAYGKDNGVEILEQKRLALGDGFKSLAIWLRFDLRDGRALVKVNSRLI